MQRDVLEVCPKCGTRIYPDDNFCPACGQKVCTVCICPYTRSLYDCGHDDCLPYAKAYLWEGDKDGAGQPDAVEIGVHGAIITS